MRRGKNSGGFTLAEVLVSSGLLLLLGLLTAQGFAVCGQLVLRDRQLRKADERLEERMVWEAPPDEKERVRLEAGDYGTWDVTIYTYRMRQENVETMFQILGKRENEESYSRFYSGGDYGGNGGSFDSDAGPGTGIGIGK